MLIIIATFVGNLDLISPANSNYNSGFFQLLTDLGYAVYPLPWRPTAGARLLNLDEFAASAATNFIAIKRADW